jgi:hypothetical protein
LTKIIFLTIILNQNIFDNIPIKLQGGVMKKKADPTPKLKSPTPAMALNAAQPVPELPVAFGVPDRRRASSLQVGRLLRRRFHHIG